MVISFSLSAIARLGVPPGKWFCLARTGLGYGKYSCCVCRMHHEIFSKHWHHHGGVSVWKDRLDAAILSSLDELGYRATDKEVMHGRILNLVTEKQSYFVNPEFQKLVDQGDTEVLILTNGPECLAKLIFGESVRFANKKDPTVKSDVHVGTNASDYLQVKQTKILVSKENKIFENLPSKVRIVPRLTSAVMADILRMEIQPKIS